MQEVASNPGDGNGSMSVAEAEADRIFLWECCHRIRDTEASAKLILAHLGEDPRAHAHCSVTIHVQVTFIQGYA